MPDIRLLIEYDGTAFHGWQVQPDQRTVQGVLQDALGQLTGDRVKLVAAGRTDAGVHAAGQVASFKTACTVPPERIGAAVNGLLPPEVAVVESAEAPDGFHARRP